MPDARRPSRTIACSICGSDMWRDPRTKTPENERRCRACKAASIEHGTQTAYAKRGCRCVECCAANTQAARQYRGSRMAAGLTALPWTMKSWVCEHCDVAFEARSDKTPRFCSRDCRMLSEHGWVQPPNPRRRFRPSKSLRDSVFERDGWLCHLCGDVVDRSVHYLNDAYPSLDHVVPMSRGGEDTFENLRTAHRLCNSIRGVREVAA